MTMHLGHLAIQYVPHAINGGRAALGVALIGLGLFRPARRKTGRWAR
jgi:hypothetical protein